MLFKDGMDGEVRDWEEGAATSSFELGLPAASLPFHSLRITHLWHKVIGAHERLKDTCATTKVIERIENV